MKPNIVFVMTDQHRADLRRGCGYALDTMPYLDSFAAKGFDMRRAYTSNPVCVPARVSMFTGRYPSAHKARTNHNLCDVIRGDDLLDVLKRAGYTLALCGKNHTYRKVSDFDYVKATGHLGTADDGTFSDQQKEFEAFLSASKHMESDIPSPGTVENQHPYRNVSAAFDFLDNHRGSEPFFLWLSFAEPHNPYQVPAPYFDMFPPESLPPLSCGAETCSVKGEDYVWERNAWERVLGPEADKRIQRVRSNYHGMLRLIDDQFKRFIYGLEERGLRDNTVVVFLSDHGDFAGEYGLIRKGVGLPEVLCRINMMWQGPGIIRRCDEEHCVSIVDILPTVCELCGEDIPFGCQGRSLVSLLRDEKIPEKEFATAYCEFGHGGLYWNESDRLSVTDDRCITDGTTFACISSWTSGGQLRSLRKGNLKIIMDMMGRGQLYDLSVDPYEVNDLWDNADYAVSKADMLSELCAAILRSDDPIPAPHNRYRTKRHPRGYWFDEDYISDDPGVPNDCICDYLRGKIKVK